MAEKTKSIKEKIQQEQFIRIIRQLLEGVEGNRPFALSIQGQECEIPANVLQKAALEIEYEREQGKTELEIKIEW